MVGGGEGSVGMNGSFGQESNGMQMYGGGAASFMANQPNGMASINQFGF